MGRSGVFGYNVDNNQNESGNVPAYYFGRPNTNFGQAYMRMTTDGNWYFYNTPNGSNTRHLTMQLVRDGYLLAPQSVRSPIFYDSNDTAYFCDPNGRSRLSSIDYGNGSYYLAGGDWGWRHNTPYGWIQFGPANSSHAHIYTDRSNFYFNVDVMYQNGHRIYGDNYRPYADTAGTASSSTTAAYLPTLYAGGVQSNPQTYFGQSVGLRVAMTGHWSVWSDTLWINGYAGGDVLQMCALHTLRNGQPRMAISAQACNGSSYGSIYEFWTNYNMDAPNKSGTSYYQANTWIQFNGGYGLYFPNNYGGHFYPNDGSSYTQFRLSGQKNGYGGIWDSYSAVAGIMYDSGGNGGVYREANGRWYFYYHLSNDCMGIGTSSTSSTYSLYLNKGVFAQSRIDATIFYDTNDTSRYIDPNGTSQTNSMRASEFRGNANVGGTGEATWHPAGAYIGSTMWQYGDMYKNNTPIYDVANIYNSGWYRNYGRIGVYNQTYGGHFYQSESSYWSITGAGTSTFGLQFRSNYDTGVVGYVYGESGG